MALDNIFDDIPMGRLHSAAFRQCEVWKRSAEEVSTKTMDSSYRREHKLSFFFPLGANSVAFAVDWRKRKLFADK